MYPEPTFRRFPGAAFPRKFLAAAGALGVGLVVSCASAAAATDAAHLLQQADRVKTANHAQFVALLGELDGQSEQLSPAQKEYLRYLKAWKAVNEGDDETVIPTLKDIIQKSKDITLQFRARSTLMNLLQLTHHYEAAYSELNRQIELLPRVSDMGAREQALMNAAQLYRAVGQTDLSVHYAQMVIDENWLGRGLCFGSQQKLAALYEGGQLTKVGAETEEGTQACEKQGELAYANEIRMHAAKLYIDRGRLDDAIALLKGHYEQVLKTQYARLISAFDALLAEAYERKGYAALAQTFATNSLAHAGKNPHVGNTRQAFLVLYEVAKQRGDFKSALALHEQYVAADLDYTDDASARQLAYNKIAHETLASQLQIAALTKQNRVLQLQKALTASAVENSRLYIVLLLTVLIFIILWAYKTKRSQLHFMSMSRLDGLTGICNRHHFINLAERALESSRRSRQELCIILCDLDHFKSINDRHGHAMGDFVLRETVARCRVHLREDDAFGRFGGEEFSVLLPGCDPEVARQRAEQLRLQIAGITAGFGPFQSKVSASFGIAATRMSGYELRQLLAHADSALYRAKRAGRNRVVLSDGSAGAEGPSNVGERPLLPPRSSASA